MAFISELFALNTYHEGRTNSQSLLRAESSRSCSDPKLNREDTEDFFFLYPDDGILYQGKCKTAFEEIKTDKDYQALHTHCVAFHDEKEQDQLEGQWVECKLIEQNALNHCNAILAKFKKGETSRRDTEKDMKEAIRIAKAAIQSTVVPRIEEMSKTIRERSGGYSAQENIPQNDSGYLRDEQKCGYEGRATDENAGIKHVLEILKRMPLRFNERLEDYWLEIAREREFKDDKTLFWMGLAITSGFIIFETLNRR